MRAIPLFPRKNSKSRLFTDTFEITERYDKAVIQANIENWSDLIKDFTPRTLLVPISLDDARILLQGYEDLEKRPEDVAAAAAAYVTTGNLSASLNEEEDSLLKSLSTDIQSAILELASVDQMQGCFVKLSSRSPKDSAARSGLLERYYRAMYFKGMDENTKIKTLCEIEGRSLRFKDARAVVRALILSERVWQVDSLSNFIAQEFTALQDLTLAFRHPDDWQMNIVFREWQSVPIDMVNFPTVLQRGSS